MNLLCSAEFGWSEYNPGGFDIMLNNKNALRPILRHK
jgi:hypothetical protein